MKLLVYLLPFAGEMLLNRFLEYQDFSIQAAFLPKKYETQCNNIITMLNDKGIPYIFPKNFQYDSTAQDWVESFDVDLGVSVGYDKKVPPWLIQYPSHGTLNIHPSLLPRYRGANPYFWVIRNRESKTGVTVHWMNEEFDRGPIILQEEITIRDRETMGTIYFRLHPLGLDLVEEIIRSIQETGRAPEATEQPENSSGYPTAPEVTRSHRRIDWSQTVEEVEALIRAGNPHYPATTNWSGFTIQVYQATVIDPDAGPSDSPGRIVRTEDELPVVQCGSGLLKVEVVAVPNQGIFKTNQLDDLSWGPLNTGKSFI